MRITINDNNEITGYAIVGGIEGDFEIDDSIIPQDFLLYFKPKRYLYNEGKIVINDNFEENNEITQPETPPTINLPSSDTELRKMFANMQEQLVQGNTIVMQVTQQNAKLSQEIVELKNEIETIKGADKNEDAVSKV